MTTTVERALLIVLVVSGSVTVTVDPYSLWVLMDVTMVLTMEVGPPTVPLDYHALV